MAASDTHVRSLGGAAGGQRRKAWSLTIASPSISSKGGDNVFIEFLLGL